MFHTSCNQVYILVVAVYLQLLAVYLQLTTNTNLETNINEFQVLISWTNCWVTQAYMCMHF